MNPLDIRAGKKQWIAFLASDKCSELLKPHPHFCTNCGEKWKCYGFECPLAFEEPCDKCELTEAQEHAEDMMDRERERL